jgi:hypothetical protein
MLRMIAAGMLVIGCATIAATTANAAACCKGNTCCTTQAGQCCSTDATGCSVYTCPPAI